MQRNQVLRYLFCSFLIYSLCLPESVADNLPYELCPPKYTNYTRNIAQKASEFSASLEPSTEAEACTRCQPTNRKGTLINFLQKSVEAFEKSDRVIPRECFLSSALSGANVLKTFTKCDARHEKRDGEQRHCVNKTYIDMVRQAFSDMVDCFNFSSNEARNMFKLINHESRFMLNAQSDSSARCFGQITQPRAKDINKIINGNTSLLSYEKAVEKCPSLKSLKIADNRIEPKGGYHHLTCKLSQNPYACLLYTFISVEHHNQEIQKTLDDSREDTYRRKNLKKFTPTQQEKFVDTFMDLNELSIHLNEMLRVQGVVNGNQVNEVFWDDAELHRYLKRRNKQIDSGALTAEKVSVFQNEEDVKWTLSYWAHNGGGSIYRTHFPVFLEAWKKKIALHTLGNTCVKDPNLDKCIFLRRMRAGGGGISNEDFIRLFKIHIGDNNKISRKEEVAKFVTEVIDDAKEVFGQTHQDVIKSQLEKINTSLNEKQIDAFLDSLPKLCGD